MPEMRKPIQAQASCQDDYDPQSLSCDQALERILASVDPVGGAEKVSIRDALGRVLAHDLRSVLDVPLHDNSAMDGYAVRAEDIPSNGEAVLELIGTAWAGKPFTEPVGTGQCVRIMTGAVMPNSADTVIIQEHVQRNENLVRIGDEHKFGQNVRAAGEDIKQGQTVLPAGRRLMAADLGLTASVGIGEVTVYRRPRVVFFSTGDELRSIGEQLAKGQIYDSNRYTLHGMLRRLGTEVIDMGVVRDNRTDTQRAFREAAEIADVLITSGGVSVGDADFVTETLEALGEIDFWKVAMKPGRPLAFGRLGNATFFGLPGNPVSVMVTFYQFVQPALRRIMGELETHPLTLKARCITRLRKRPGRVEYQRGILEQDHNGELTVRSTGSQGSGILRSMTEANCFIVLPMDSGPIEPATMVDVQPFSSLI